KKALLIVDMQNDFLTEKGMFGDKHIRPDDLCNNINKMIDSREYDNIIFVQAEYDNIKKIKQLERPTGDKYKNIPMNDDFLSGTHTDEKRNCCVKGSDGAKIYDKLHIESAHKIITKKYYSAFTETELHIYLIANNIKTLCVAGVATHVCILATVTDAFFHGYDVIVNENCVASKKPQSKEDALDKIDKFYGKVKKS
ncbi:MAG: isochorismatase hydrolase, partial [Edafosvirus sp.]